MKRKPVVAETWGSVEERYRKLCMECLVHRYLYYVIGKPTATDEQYDRLEQLVAKYEGMFLESGPHPNSPTQVPGSDNPADYPAGIRWYVHQYLGFDRPRHVPKKRVQGTSTPIPAKKKLVLKGRS